MSRVVFDSPRGSTIKVPPRFASSEWQGWDHVPIPAMNPTLAVPDRIVYPLASLVGR